VAEALKHQLGPDLPGRIAETLAATQPGFDSASFDSAGFVEFCLDGYDDLELTARGQRMADAMAIHLPADRGEAIRILLASLEHGPQVAIGEDGTPDDGASSGWEVWFYLPHTRFVGDHGLDHFDLAMEAQHRLTQLFTAEFSIRPFLETHTEATLARLRDWATDPDEHVRRLVSEGTRPRLPWAGRLRHFQADPSPVVELLELLKDDPSAYVRRSVANNLNDIAKDHPDVVIDIAARWWADGSPDRRRLIRHGLRTLLKRGDVDALAVMGFGADSPAEITDLRVTPSSIEIGTKLKIEVDVNNPSGQQTGALVDLVVHYVKANGSTSPKVFRGAELQLEPGERRTVRKTISFAQHSTRTHYPGTHHIDVQLNGEAARSASFEVV
jgi:3-methyladenine DNA glycosylase AlkC